MYPTDYITFALLALNILNFPVWEWICFIKETSGNHLHNVQVALNALTSDHNKCIYTSNANKRLQ